MAKNKNLIPDTRFLIPFRWLALVPIYAYRLFISPLYPTSCRYQPTCSAYAIAAIKTHGVWTGTRLAIKRIARCHPSGGRGYDPVPKKEIKDYEPTAAE